MRVRQYFIANCMGVGGSGNNDLDYCLRVTTYVLKYDGM